MKLTDQELALSSLAEVRKGRIPPSRPHCPSRHSDCLVYVLSGEALYLFGEQCLTAQEGCVIYLAHQSRYSIVVTDENYRYINVDFFWDRPGQEPLENEIYRGKSIALLKSDFETLLRLWNTKRPWDRVACKALCYTIYAELMHWRLSDGVTTERAEQMEEITRYLAEHLSDPEESVASLAARFGLSEGHLRRLFSHVYHSSPSRFLTSLRLQKAKELLSQTPLPIAEISEACGFKNHYYFSKVFKARNGLSPGSYRKRTRGGI